MLSIFLTILESLLETCNRICDALDAPGSAHARTDTIISIYIKLTFLVLIMLSSRGEIVRVEFTTLSQLTVR